MRHLSPRGQRCLQDTRWHRGWRGCYRCRDGQEGMQMRHRSPSGRVGRTDQQHTMHTRCADQSPSRLCQPHIGSCYTGQSGPSSQLRCRRCNSGRVLLGRCRDPPHPQGRQTHRTHRPSQQVQMYQGRRESCMGSRGCCRYPGCPWDRQKPSRGPPGLGGRTRPRCKTRMRSSSLNQNRWCQPRRDRGCRCRRGRW
jgi:hypothetical protein